MSQGSRLPVLQSHSQRETSYTVLWSANPTVSFFKTGPEPATSYTSHATAPSATAPQLCYWCPCPYGSLTSLHLTLNTAAMRSPEKPGQGRCYFARIPAMHFQDTPSRRQSPVAVDLPPCGPVSQASHAPVSPMRGQGCCGATTPTCQGAPASRGPHSSGISGSPQHPQPYLNHHHSSFFRQQHLAT